MFWHFPALDAATVAAITEAMPLARVAGIAIKDTYFGAIAVRDPVAVLWRVLDRCVVPAEHRLGPAALIKVVVSFPYNQRPTTSILAPLTTNYPALVHSLQVLKITNNVYDESDALSAFAALATQLRELTFWGCGLSSVQGMEGRCEYLRKVNLVACQRLCSLDALRGCVYLQELDASGTGIPSIEALRTCPALTKVVFCGCQKLTSIHGLEDHRWLQEVDASYTGITTVEPLRTCPNLKKVDLIGCRQLSSLEALAGHQWLQEVTASNTPITSIEPLRTCPALTSLDLGGCHQLLSIQALEDHQCLCEFDASGTAITSIEPLRTCPALTTVVLNGCRQLPPIDVSLPTGIRVIRNW